MKYINLTFLLLGLICYSCKPNVSKNDATNDDKIQIEKLVVQVLKWHDKNGLLDGFKPIYNPADSLAIGMDMQALQNDLDNLTKSNFFDKEFIDHYGEIVKTIDEKIKNKEIVFNDGDMPPYAGADPWCNCQDMPYPNPWDKIEFKFISIDKDNADLTWTWTDPVWSEDFEYKVKAKKSEGTWKISYLEGFEYDIMMR